MRGTASTASTRSSRTNSARLRILPTSPPRSSRSGPGYARTGASSRSRTLYRLPEEDNRSTTTLEHGELLLEVELPPVEASVYLKAMDRKRWSFPQVGVAAARAGGETRIALAGVAPTPWRIESVEDLERATPLPRTEWKVPLARALVRRALASLG